MNTTYCITGRERELGAIIRAYNEVTEKLKRSHEMLLEEARRLREQVEEKNRELARRERLAALGEMAAGVAHEIRNPLAGIQLYASLLIRDLADRTDARELARKIATGVQTLEGIVSDVLAFSQESEANRAPVRVADVVRASLALAAPAQRDRGTTVRIGAAVADVKIVADAGQLQRALLNLIFNAIDAAGDRGQVWIDAELSRDGTRGGVLVADDGPGVPEAIADRIFNPFFTTKDSGTGLGLAIVHRIAESNGGAVAVRRRPGGGALFRLEFPIAEA